MFQSSPETAAAIEAIKAILVSLPIGQAASYPQLSEAAGFDVTANRYALNKARSEAEKECGGLFEPLRGLGIRRMESERAPDVGLHAIRKVRRSAVRSAERLGHVRVNDMSDTDRNRFTSHKAQLGAIALLADGRKTATISLQSKGHELPPKDALLALVKRIQKEKK